MFDASTFFEEHRLPELFCGFEKKRKNEGPIAYPVACSPQAWAVDSVYMLLQDLFGIRIVAKNQTVYFFDPVLPDFLDEIIISNLNVNDGKPVIQVRKLLNNETVVNVLL